MALDPKSQTATALHRFGLGPKPGALDAFANDPRGALIADLSKPGAGQIVNDDLMTTAEALRAAYDFRQEKKAARLARRVEEEQDRAARNAMAKAGAGAAAPPPNGTPAMDQKPKQQPGVPQQIFLDEARARLDAALNADVGFAERLVWFWSNHFCISADKGVTRPICGAFEREAIRPHIAGKFADMLLAVEQHPAMLFYLDNTASIGPNSFAGKRRGKGLNENLAREIMELHTLGVRTGYSQADVTNFAKVITGWTIVPVRQDGPRAGTFFFNERMHEPGVQHVIDRDYAQDGVAQGEAALRRLAAHPATAKHVALKLARHFVADEPPPSLVERLRQRFADTDGDLKEVSIALVTAPEAWDAPRTKLRKPNEWMVASMRATGILPSDVRPLINADNMLGEPLWRPPAPNGFSDMNDAWTDGLASRLDIANRFSRQVAELVDPETVAEQSFGPLLSRDTRETLARAESRAQAVALLLMAPEFQRR
ncbi:MAG: DUF1800 family protein [Proteobacteria bacterium]|nr:DUF1800 family protein [Pseudomonadota bacterium]